MGTEAFWIPAVMAAVGAGTTYVNNRQMTKKRDAIALQSLHANTDRQKRADKVAQDAIAAAANSTPEAEKKTAMAGYMDQLRKAKPDAQAGLQDFGGTSAAYRKDAASAALGIDDAAQNYASLASRLEAPAMQREREARDRANSGVDLGVLGREQEGDDRMTNLRLQGVRGNPFLEILAAVAGGASSGYGKGGGAATSTGQPATAFGYGVY